jgi:predicted acetyltransferase
MQAVEIKVATQEQKPVMKWLLELYVEEFALLKGEQVAQKQMFIDSGYVDLFWKKPEWVPLLILYHDKVAGFALVVSHNTQSSGLVRVLPEFFILKRNRHVGIGKQAAYQIFDKFPGHWEVRESDFNASGQEFWRKVIQEYTGGQFTENIVTHAEWNGPVQSFDNSSEARPQLQAGS